MRGVLRVVAIALSGVLLVSGCSAPADTGVTPGITTALTRVDEALASGDLASARTALELLTALTENAHADERIDDATAERVLAAAAALQAEMTAYAADASDETASTAKTATTPASSTTGPRSGPKQPSAERTKSKQQQSKKAKKKAKQKKLKHRQKQAKKQAKGKNTRGARGKGNNGNGNNGKGRGRG